MLKYFIFILTIVGLTSVINKLSGYNKFVRSSKKSANSMYKNKYIKNKVYDFLILILFFLVILLTIFHLDL